MDIVFGRPRHDYVPYWDFFKLAQLSGFTVQYVDEIDWLSPGIVIATPLNSEWWDIPKDRSKKLIWWNLERGSSPNPMDMSSTHAPPFVDEVWTSDRAFSLETGARYVFLGGHPEFSMPKMARTSSYEVVSLMYWYGRRDRLKNALISRFSLADPNGNMWGELRHKTLYASQIMVSAHQDEKPWCEPIRFMIAASYGLPLVSESCADSGHWKSGVHFLSGPMEHIPALVEELLSNYHLRTSIAKNAHHLVCVERTFEKEVKEAIS